MLESFFQCCESGKKAPSINVAALRRSALTIFKPKMSRAYLGISQQRSPKWINVSIKSELLRQLWLEFDKNSVN